ncbi:MAG TPA: terminase small subunit [Ruminiclostridium sp.]
MRQGLTVKQEKYVQGLFTGLSQREAYKQSYSYKGMTDKTIDEQACRLANDYKLNARLNELKDIVAKKNILTAEWVLNNLRSVAERCMQQEPVYIYENGEKVESGEFKFDSSGANKSLELLGKHLKLFTEKVESTNTNLNYDMTDEDKLFRSKATPEEIEKYEKGMEYEKINEILNR